AGSALTVTRSTFSGNRAIDGGAIGVWGGSQGTITKDIFANNEVHGNTGAPGQPGTTSDNGGAIFTTAERVVSATRGSMLSVLYSSFVANVAHGADGGAGTAGVSGGVGGQGAGGAIGIGGVGSVANISHSTFIGNQAVGGAGGAGGTGADGGNGGPGAGG